MSPSPDVWELASNRDFAGLIALLDRDPETRRSASFVIGFLAEQGTYDLASMRLVIPLMEHREPEVRAAAAYAIGECALHGLLDSTCLEKLHALFSDADADVRRMAVSAATWLATKGVRDEKTVTRFNRALGDAEAEVRMAATASLAMLARSGIVDESSISPLELVCEDTAVVTLSGFGLGKGGNVRTTVAKVARVALGEVRKKLGD